MNFYDQSIQYLLSEIRNNGGTVTLQCARSESETLRVLDRMVSDQYVEIAGHDALRITYRITRKGEAHLERHHSHDLVLAA